MNNGEKHTLIVSLNAAVDRVINLSNLAVGQVNRATHAFDQAGGKGINVARALTALGRRVLVIGFTGGMTGDQIRKDLLYSQIPCSLIPIKGQSRSCYIFVDQADKSQTVINEAGPEILPAEYEQFYSELTRRLDDAEMLICSGSLPRGVTPDCYREFVGMANARGLRALVDATGESLRLALEAEPFLVKPNRDEAEQLLGSKILDDESLAAARAIHARGAKIGLLSLGASGAAAAWDGGEIFVRAPTVPLVNAVASGDAFLAGCAAAALADTSVEEMVRWGVAAGSANAEVGGARITRAEFERLLAAI